MKVEEKGEGVRRLRAHAPAQPAPRREAERREAVPGVVYAKYFNAHTMQMYKTCVLWI